MKVRLTQLDGKLPNLAIMKLAHWHRSQGDEIVFSRHPQRDMFETDYDRVYGSAIFTYSLPQVERLKREFPGAIIGGTGAQPYRSGEYPTVEQFLGIGEYEHYDYSLYPSFDGSIGFTARGCRLKCGFCIVPLKEGKPRSVNTIYDIWRGAPNPRHLHLLDNDFFGQPREQWEARIEEMRTGKFKACFNQGINIRMITEESAAALNGIDYFDDSFKHRRIYTAWDNLKDEPIFTRGIEKLLAAGTKPSWILVYMLVGFDKAETWERIFYRFNQMLKMGVLPYPMVFSENSDRKLKQFQRWVVRRYYQIVPFDEYCAKHGRDDTFELHEQMKEIEAASPSPFRARHAVVRETNELPWVGKLVP